MNYRKIWEKAKNEKLTSKDIIHHINFNSKDNRIENLWKCDKEKHRKAHKSLNRIIRRLLKRAIKNKIVRFDTWTGKYNIDENFDVVFKNFYIGLDE